ncbi:MULTISPECIES: hypothetical protein [unclassified Actinomadura]|nr:hypothetical protein [Actinomadura sp. K4S16]
MRILITLAVLLAAVFGVPPLRRRALAAFVRGTGTAVRTEPAS